MSEYSEIEALRTYSRGVPKTVSYSFDKVECPICGKMCGGKSLYWGDRGKFEGVNMHMRFAHGIKSKKAREKLLEE